MRIDLNVIGEQIEPDLFPRIYDTAALRRPGRQHGRQQADVLNDGSSSRRRSEVSEVSVSDSKRALRRSSFSIADKHSTSRSEVDSGVANGVQDCDLDLRHSFVLYCKLRQWKQQCNSRADEEPPAVPRVAEQEMATYGHPGVTGHQQQWPPLASEYQEAHDENPYCYHWQSGQSQWELPLPPPVKRKGILYKGPWELQHQQPLMESGVVLNPSAKSFVPNKPQMSQVSRR